jgi:hypothetical protein
MRRIARVLVLILPALFGLTRVVRAQGNTAEMLQRAIRLYESVEIEQSLVLLNQIISPESPYVVTEAQRVTAFKYLGAALALQRGAAKQDSAVRYFRAAIERDPFTDLNPQSFSPAQLQTFGRARVATFAVGLRPVAVDTVDPRTGRFRFVVLTTHAARIRLELRGADDRVRRVVFDGDNDGLREVEWDGLGGDGRLVAAGRYDLVLLGESRSITVPQAVRDSARVYFQLDWVHEAIEDSLADLPPQDLLAEQYPASAATNDLLKGVGVAAAAALTQAALANSDLGANRTAAGVVALGGLTVGIAAFFHRQSHRTIPANILVNAQRRATRAAINAEIGTRNDAKLAETRLAVAPAAGAGR